MPPRAYAVTDVRCFIDASSGEVMATHRQAGYPQWQALVEAFGDLTVVARVHPHPLSSGPTGSQVSGPHVRVLATNYYTGGKGLLLRAVPILFQLLKEFDRRSVVLVRVPEPLGLLAGFAGLMRGAKVVSNIVIDPLEAPGPNGDNILVRAVQRGVLTLARCIVWRSHATLYVSERALQARMPGRPNRPSLVRSNVDLHPTEILATPRSRLQPMHPLRLVTLASFTDHRKGVDVILRSLATLRNRHHLDAVLHVVGDGQVRPQLEAMALELGLRPGDDVLFRGQLNGRAEIFALLDDADLYVSASRAEGLPRAIIEAQARGLPCVSSDVGAVAELLPECCLVKPNDPDALAAAVARIAHDPAQYVALSEHGLQRARAIAAQADPQRLVGFLRSFITAFAHND